MKIISPVFVLIFFACSQPPSNNTDVATETITAQTKEHLLSLEHK